MHIIVYLKTAGFNGDWILTDFWEQWICYIWPEVREYLIFGVAYKTISTILWKNIN